MLFKLSYSIPVELLKECQERFKSGEEKTDGLKVIGRWVLSDKSAQASQALRARILSGYKRAPLCKSSIAV